VARKSSAWVLVVAKACAGYACDIAISVAGMTAFIGSIEPEGNFQAHIDALILPLEKQAGVQRARQNN